MKRGSSRLVSAPLQPARLGGHQPFSASGAVGTKSPSCRPPAADAAATGAARREEGLRDTGTPSAQYLTMPAAQEALGQDCSMTD